MIQRTKLRLLVRAADRIRQHQPNTGRDSFPDRTESWSGSVQSRMPIFGQRHLRLTLLSDYESHYNHERPHRAQGLRSPLPSEPGGRQHRRPRAASGDAGPLITDTGPGPLNEEASAMDCDRLDFPVLAEFPYAMCNMVMTVDDNATIVGTARRPGSPPGDATVASPCRRDPHRRRHPCSPTNHSRATSRATGR